MTKLLSFHNNPAIKQQTLHRLKIHLSLDEIIKGTGYDNGRGCAVGCTLNEYNHKAYENELGLPEWLARLEDVIFENLPDGLHKTFPLEMIEAIPVGVCTEKVGHIIAIKRLVSLAQKNLEVTDVIMAVVDLHERTLEGEEIKEGEWERAARSIWAIWAGAARSARSAVEAVAWVAWVARPGESGASGESARSAHWVTERDNLLAALRSLT